MNEVNIDEKIRIFDYPVLFGIKFQNGSYADINAQLNLLAAKGDAKILSQPYIITMSGDKSEVFIGGQLPIPVSNDNDVTVEWKDYGIKLNIEPVVLPSACMAFGDCAAYKA